MSKDEILMCPPDFFTVDYVINPWMAGHEDSLSLDEAKNPCLPGYGSSRVDSAPISSWSA